MDVECPNCGGSGRAGEIPVRGGFIKGRCFMCNGTCWVPDWDYDRLLKMVKERTDCVQTSLSFTKESK